MPRLTEDEREQRRRKLQQEALDSVAARGQFNFRLDSGDIRRLYQLAGLRQKPVSAMVREWVVERLDKEEVTEAPPAPPWADELDRRMLHMEVLIALVARGHVKGKNQDVYFAKLHEHIQQHCSTESDQQLLELLKP